MICDLCSREVEESFICSVCNAEVCEFCGDPDKKVCDMCSERTDDDSDLGEDY